MIYWLKARIRPSVKLYLIAILMGTEFIIIIHNYYTAISDNNRLKYLVSDLSCHYSEDDDVILAAEDSSFSPKHNSIFFHETSCSGQLTSWQACSVESVAKLHPNRQVYVLFSAPVNIYTQNHSCLKTLRQYDNVHVARVHLSEYIKNTVLEEILDDMNARLHPILVHIADIIRVVTLYKWGGLYLDTDMIVARSLNTLPPNWVAKLSDRSVSSGILSFSNNDVGRNITTALLRELFATYDYYQLTVNFRKAIAMVIGRCSQIISLENCLECRTYPYELFNPLYHTIQNVYFKSKNSSVVERPYAYHMSSLMSGYETIENVYADLARKFCPLIFNKYSEDFGG